MICWNDCVATSEYFERRLVLRFVRDHRVKLTLERRHEKKKWWWCMLIAVDLNWNSTVRAKSFRDELMIKIRTKLNRFERLLKRVFDRRANMFQTSSRWLRSCVRSFERQEVQRRIIQKERTKSNSQWRSIQATVFKLLLQQESFDEEEERHLTNSATKEDMKSNSEQWREGIEQLANELLIKETLMIWK